jgi:hypothetical protein
MAGGQILWRPKNHRGSGLLGVRARGVVERGGDRELREMLTTDGSEGKRQISAGGCGGQQLGAAGLRDGDHAPRAISRWETAQGVQLGREELLVVSSFSCSGLARRIEQSTPAVALGLAAAMLCEAMQSGGAGLRGEA